MTGLGLFAAARVVFPYPPAEMFAALGAASLLLALLGLRTHRIVGLAFRGRLIARREREPLLYWASIIEIGLASAILWAMAHLASR